MVQVRTQLRGGRVPGPTGGELLCLVSHMPTEDGETPRGT